MRCKGGAHGLDTDENAKGKSTWAHTDAGELRGETWGSHILGSSTEGLGFKYRGTT